LAVAGGAAEGQRIRAAAEREGPQVITRHGEEMVVMVHVGEYRRMSERDGGEKKWTSRSSN